MKQLVVTGANGQLGRCLQLAFTGQHDFELRYETSETLDISNPDQLAAYFKAHSLDYFINCAAYTAVDAAESNPEKAKASNHLAVKQLAQLCEQHEVVLIHFSTDYVFDGAASEPYLETDKTGPINVYGQTKLDGEQAIRQCCKAHFIIRTSWLYSQFGKNFYRTIRARLEAGATLSVVTDQTGTPTNANDLAAFVLSLIQKQSTAYGTYHYSNTGAATWYDFALKIAQLLPNIPTERVAAINHYATFAQRPAYSVLSKSKIATVFNCVPPNWEDSLKDLIKTQL